MSFLGSSSWWRPDIQKLTGCWDIYTFDKRGGGPYFLLLTESLICLNLKANTWLFLAYFQSPTVWTPMNTGVTFVSSAKIIINKQLSNNIGANYNDKALVMFLTFFSAGCTVLCTSPHMEGRIWQYIWILYCIIFSSMRSQHKNTYFPTIWKAKYELMYILSVANRLLKGAEWSFAPSTARRPPP